MTKTLSSARNSTVFKIKNWYIISLINLGLLWVNHCTYAQQHDYIVKDSAYKSGIVIPLHKDRQVQFQVLEKDTPIKYTSNEIKEYGYGGHAYESISLNGESLFYLRLVYGKNSLYSGKSFFIIKTEDTLAQFNRKNYRSVLSSQLKCNGSNLALSKLSYSKSSLRRYVQRINSGECNTDQLAYSKIGIMAGYQLMRFDLGSNLVDNTGSPFIGLFADFAPFTSPSIYITTELHYTQSRPDFYTEEQNNTSFIGLNLNSLSAPVSIKWIASRKTVKPYIKAGAIVSAFKINSPTGYVKTKTEGLAIAISRDQLNNSIIPLYGVSAGIGLEIPLRNRTNFHIELKYVKTLSQSVDTFNMSYSGFYFLSGFNI